MKILAIIIPNSDRHGDSFIHLPIGMGYILGSIRKEFPQTEIKVLDFILDKVLNEQDIKRYLLENNEFKPDYVLFSGMITRYRYIKMLSHILKEVFSNAVQVVGGSVAATAYKQLAVNSYIDIFVIGEGEKTIVDILNEKPLLEIQGIAINKPYGNCILTTPRERITNLDAIEFPAYDLIDVSKYIEAYSENTGWKFLPIIASRGCPFNCNFCYRNFGSQLFFRSPELVINELLFLKKQYGIDSFYLYDEIQFLNKQWMQTFAEALLRRNVNLKWSVVSRVNFFQERERKEVLELLSLCKKAGALRITVGIESGNQSMLNAMNKKTTIEGIEYAIRLIRKAGIKATGSMLVGYPGETCQTIQQSVDFANRNLLKTSFYCLIPLPGTALYDQCISQGIITNEDAYLEKISEHGDASHIYKNLSNMTDEEYFDSVQAADRAVSKIPIKSYFNYYGFFRGCVALTKQFFKDINTKMHQRRFETP